jgi:cytochrome c peroxidase
MKTNDARLIAAGAFLCALGAWCDAGCGGDIERESLGSGTAADRVEGLRPLATVAVPQPQGGQIVDRAAAVVLGKALFWDQQSGADGMTACATCHATAGADARQFNIVNPGPNGIFEACGTTGPSQYTTPCDGMSDDRLGSEGVVAGSFDSIASDPSSAADVCTPVAPGPYGTARQVTGRNAPSVVAAVFFRDVFSDGRANHTFNGVDPFGATPNALQAPLNSIGNGALASQATGPANNGVEMSCAGRPFNGPNSLAAKLLARQPLQLQSVSPTDSVLGSLSAAPNRGLKTTYGALLSKAFGRTVSSSDEVTKFSAYWGQAIQAYESTLIPDQTPFDKFLAGNTAAMTSNQQRGLDRFTGKAGCANCHAGAELSDATVSFWALRGGTNEDGGDQGFHNIGVRPTAEDLGRAGSGPGGAPFAVNGSNQNRGAFKTPQLRNVKLTAPYFHGGNKASLTSVVNFYNKGGDFANPEKASRVRRLDLDSQDVAALVDFLTNGLTDCRTEKERAPFDHPSLAFPDGPTRPAVGANGTGSCP